MERMERRWSEFTREDIQKIADTTLPEKYSDNWLAKGEYTPPLDVYKRQTHWSRKHAVLKSNITKCDGRAKTRIVALHSMYLLY